MGGSRLEFNTDGELKTTGGGGGGTSDVNIAEVAGSAPALSNPLPVELSDGTQALGTASNPLRVNPTGTTPQPVTGTVTANQGGAPWSDNLSQWGGAALPAAPATAPVGTEIAPIVRQISTKHETVSSQTPLGSSLAFTSPWIDTAQTGDSWVVATVRANQASASNGFTIQSSNDSADSNFTTIEIQTSVSANTTTTIQASIRQRYYRVVYTNGAIAQATFNLRATASNSQQFPATSGLAAGGVGTLQPFMAFNSAAAASADGLNNSFTGISAGNGSFSQINALALAFNGTNWDRIRTPTTFKTVQATSSGNNGIWTPTSGKKFRLMRLFVEVTDDASLAAGGILTVTFQDNTTGIGIAFDVYLPAASLGAPIGAAFTSGWIDLGNGVLSAAINQTLNVNLSAALTAGKVRVNVCGTEE